MFVSLADKKAAEYYRQESWEEPERESLARLLEKLSEKPYAEKLSVVTSIGHLFLTTALRLDDNTKNDSVFLEIIKDAGKHLVVMSYHSDGRRKADAERRCTLEEAADYIDLYVMRMILEKYGAL